MIRVAALTSGRNAPSARFRIRQHVAPLEKLGVSVREYVPAIDSYAAPPGLTAESVQSLLARPYSALWYGAKLASRLPGVVGSRGAQITWLCRGMQSGRYTFEHWLKHPVIFDVDDAIWLTRPGAEAAIARMARQSQVVLAGNAYLADWFGQHCRDVRIVPTALDTERFRPRLESDPPRSGRFTIGWTGLAGNYRYLQTIEPVLSRFLRERDADLLLVADAPPAFATLPADRVRFVRWSPENEASAVREMDVGLMPLPCDDWTRGKCSFKMLQYMATGLPVAVSRVGMNDEILKLAPVGFGADSLDEWRDALEALYADSSLRARMGAEGRQLVEARFSQKVVSELLLQIFREMS